MSASLLHDSAVDVMVAVIQNMVLTKMREGEGASERERERQTDRQTDRQRRRGGGGDFGNSDGCYIHSWRRWCDRDKQNDLTYHL